MLTLERRTHLDKDFCELCRELDKEFWTRYPDTQQNFEPFNKVDSTAHVLVAYSDDVAVGCGCFRPTGKQYEVEIKRMYVIPVYRGRGISKAILGALEKWARQDGYLDSKLETGVNQPEAIALYTAMGYMRIPNYPPYSDISESICMAKTF
ncbi:MAG: GNAT family N-acetyltransferase [Marivirga sp.]|nr:GNAT family N-acetyltransferase [Marivirga sp.]